MRRRGIRPIRLALWLAVLGALGLGLRQLTRARRPAPLADGWREVPSPSASMLPIIEPEIVEVGDLDRPGEPELHSDDTREVIDEMTAPAPAKTVPAKKTAPKKAAPRKAAPKRVAAGWVDPEGKVCPPSHPVKAKLNSKLFHLPGMFAYERTNPDRCYADAAAAEADGLNRSKR